MVWALDMIARRRRALLVAGALALGLAAATAVAGAEDVTPAALKAAFLYNFAKFTEWPVEPAASTPLHLCILNDQAAEEALARLAGGASINGRAVIVMRGVARERLRSCHLLYLAGDDAHSADAVVAELQGAAILTVSDGERFPRHGGMVGLLIEGNRMRFAINPETAQRSGVRLSSRLLSLATIVND